MCRPRHAQASLPAAQEIESAAVIEAAALARAARGAATETARLATSGDCCGGREALLTSRGFIEAQPADTPRPGPTAWHSQAASDRHSSIVTGSHRPLSSEAATAIAARRQAARVEELLAYVRPVAGNGSEEAGGGDASKDSAKTAASPARREGVEGNYAPVCNHVFYSALGQVGFGLA